MSPPRALVCRVGGAATGVKFGRDGTRCVGRGAIPVAISMAESWSRRGRESWKSRELWKVVNHGKVVNDGKS